MHHTAPHCNTLYSTLQHAATHCSTLQHTAPQVELSMCNISGRMVDIVLIAALQLISTHCTTLQHTAPRCNTQHHAATHTATHCNTLQNTAMQVELSMCNTSGPMVDIVLSVALQLTATHCTTLQHTAPRCNILHHTATHTAPHCNTLQHRWSCRCATHQGRWWTFF